MPRGERNTEWINYVSRASKKNGKSFMCSSTMESVKKGYEAQQRKNMKDMGLPVKKKKTTTTIKKVKPIKSATPPTKKKEWQKLTAKNGRVYWKDTESSMVVWKDPT
jgi:hypothetical protein